MNIVDFLADIELRLYEGATGLVIECVAPDGFVQLIGPYPLDTAEAFEVVESLKAEEDPDQDPCIFRVRFLFPTSHAQVQK